MPLHTALLQSKREIWQSAPPSRLRNGFRLTVLSLTNSAECQHSGQLISIVQKVSDQVALSKPAPQSLSIFVAYRNLKSANLETVAPMPEIGAGCSYPVNPTLCGSWTHRTKVPYTAVGSAGNRVFDYVTRRFNRSSARLKKSVGLDLRWDTALRDFQIQLEPRVSLKWGELFAGFVRTVPGSARNWIAVNALQQFSLSKKWTQNNDNSTLRKIN